MEEQELSDELLLKEFWYKGSGNFDNITDPTLKFIELSAQEYNKQIMDPKTGRLLTSQPWFIIFIKPMCQFSQMMRDNLEKLAHHYNGTIQFAWMNANDPNAESIRLAYWAYSTPRSYYIDPITSSAYGFQLIITYMTKTIEWIDDKQYLKSPLVFTPVPSQLGFSQKYFEYARRDVRLFWDEYVRPYSDKVLRDYHIWFLVDKNSTDWENVTLHLKPDRQIILATYILLFLGWFLLVFCILFLIIFLTKVFDIKPEDLKNKEGQMNNDPISKVVGIVQKINFPNFKSEKIKEKKE